MSKSDQRRSWPGLSAEDKELWKEVSKHIKPVRKRARAEAPRDAAPSDAAVRRDQESAAPHLPGSKKPSSKPIPSPSVTSSPPPLAGFEPKRARKIAAGRMSIDARLDLHGLYQSEAWDRLRTFLRDCHARGYRTVLVITGKGGPSEEEAPFTMDRPRERGILRRNVPLWLAEPGLRDIVVSFASAHVRHGGEGAFYVRLRRHRSRNDET
jgi:DNA-nicking Smr family endonuclease